MRKAALSAALLAIAVSACGGKTIRADEAERSVARVVARETGFMPTDIGCPSGVDAKVGGTFDCEFTGPDGRYTATVRILKVEGESVNFSVRSRRSD